MIEYINKLNIDDRVLERASYILKEGGLVAFPTDTSWSIGCNAGSKKGIDKLKKLKGDFSDKTLTLICSNISQVSEFVDVSNLTFRLLKRITPGPTVFILSAKMKIEKKINMKRLEIGIRIPENPVSTKLVEKSGFPLFSITASKIMTSQGWWDHIYAEENLFECGWELEDIPEIDLILDTGEPQPKVLSTVLRIEHDEVEVIRKGIGASE